MALSVILMKGAWLWHASVCMCSVYECVSVCVCVHESAQQQQQQQRSVCVR